MLRSPEVFYFASNQIVNDLRVETNDLFDVITKKADSTPASKAVLGATCFRPIAGPTLNRRPLTTEDKNIQLQGWGCVQKTLGT